MQYTISKQVSNHLKDAAIKSTSVMQYVRKMHFKLCTPEFEGLDRPSCSIRLWNCFWSISAICPNALRNSTMTPRGLCRNHIKLVTLKLSHNCYFSMQQTEGTIMCHRKDDTELMKRKCKSKVSTSIAGGLRDVSNSLQTDYSLQSADTHF